MITLNDLYIDSTFTYKNSTLIYTVIGFMRGKNVDLCIYYCDMTSTKYYAAPVDTLIYPFKSTKY